MPVSFRLMLGAGCIVAAIAAPVFAQSVYTWKDAKGVTHYSDSPPPESTKQKVRTVDVPPAPPSTPVVARPVLPTPAATVARAPGAAPKQPDPNALMAAAEARAAACKQAQANLEVLKTNAPVGMDQDGDGKNDSVLDAAERTKQTANMQAAVTANCAAPTP